ncbi:Mor transcription activator family protein [Clostridium cavendishii DSM 21758]|uniref:Mor transcription activator family protein n=1 Tax=Clostridium cavendishii DSM 21758 TaxID=1121302 RepID=A0A1M6NHC1_9CLOT|nr:CD3324 family protein [Clostridium cavendishii]SHJ95014.1 Mor transcription activator family protein [Clostridium cavendishii DSM 21758]
MCYIAAKEVLPIEIIELIQTYIEGEYIYIPKKEANKKPWGSTTTTRKEINLRDSSIYSEYMNGVSRNSLAEKYFLSKKSIDRIILKEKSK